MTKPLVILSLQYVINLTGLEISKPQTEVLELGLNFAPAPSKIPVKYIVAAVETGMKNLPSIDKDDLRGSLYGILRNSKPPRSNLIHKQS